MSAANLPPGQVFSLVDNWRLVNRSASYARRLRRRYRSLATMHNRKAILILDSAAAREVLAVPPSTYSPFWKEGFSGLIGPGCLFVLDGERHRTERTLLGKSLGAQHFDRYGSLIREITEKTIAGWEPGQQLRAFDEMLRNSLEFILQLTFGSEPRDVIDRGRRVMDSLVKSENPMLVFFPVLQSWWFPPWVRYARARGRFRAYVKERLDERAAQGRPGKDLLGRLLEARYEDGSRMSQEDIADELLTLVGAGHETTGTALSWALYELGRRPQILDQLRAEVDDLGVEAAPDEIVKLPYLNAVCNETLRLHTVVTEIGRVLEQPIDLLGYRIPAGWSIVISIASLHQDPRTFADPRQFNPSRFLNRSYRTYEFMPFGGGHRRCLGAAVSDYEMRIVLAQIIACWEYELLGEERDARKFIATGPRNGVRLRLTRPRRSTTPE